MKTAVLPVIALIFLSATLHAELPKELIEARESYQRSREQVLAPVTRRHLENLVILRKRFTQAGDLQAALAVDAEIQSVQRNTKAPPVPSVTAIATPPPIGSAAFSDNPFLGTWRGPGDEERRVVLPNGKLERWVRGKGGDKGNSWADFTWKRDGRTLEIYGPGGQLRQEWKLTGPDTFHASSKNKKVPPSEYRRVNGTLPQ